MKCFRKRPILRSPGKVKHWLYRRGYRPKPGTLMYSPSLEMCYRGREFGRAMREAMENAAAAYEHPDYPSDCRDSPG